MARRRTTAASGDQGPIPAVYSESVSFLMTATANEIVSSTSFLLLSLYGVGVIEQRILSQLSLEPNIRIMRVCHVSRMDKSVVSRAFARLEEKGYVARSGGGADGRRALWALTAPGAALVEKLRGHLAQRQALLNQGFSPVEQAALTVLLQKVLANAPLFSAYCEEQVAAQDLGGTDRDAGAPVKGR